MATGNSVVGLAMAWLLALALIACQPGAGPSAAPSTSRGQSTGAVQALGGQENSLGALVEGARAEGKLSLVWSEGTVGSSETIQRWAEGFNRHYGLNVDVRFTPGPPMAAIGARLISEYQAGLPASSDLYLTGANDTIPVIEAGALETVAWTAWAPQIQNSELVSADGALVAIAAPIVGIVYNTTKFTPETVPTTLADLLKPEYKGRIATTPYAALFDRLASPELWGEQRTLDYMTQFSRQIGGLIGCTDYERILSGEFDILAIACNVGQARTRHMRGEPLAYVVPSDAAMVQGWYTGVPKTAAHPNAAKL